MLNRLTLLICFLLLLSASYGNINADCIAAVYGDSTEAGVYASGDSSGSILKLEATGKYLGRGELREPLGISVGPRGEVYVADAMTGKVFRYNYDGSSVEFEKPNSSGPVYPLDLAGSTAFVYMLDYSNNRILRYDYRGAYLDILVNFEEYEDLKPVSLSLGPGGSFLLTDIENHSLTILSPSLDVEVRIGGYGWNDGYFNEPMKSVILKGGRIAVTDSGNRRLQIFSAAGVFLESIGGKENGYFCSPRSICADGEGNIFVSDAECGAVSVFSESGKFILKLDSYSGHKISPAALSVGLDNKLYVADIKSSSIIIYSIDYPDSRP